MLYNSTLVDARVNRFRAERVRAALYRAFQPLQVTAWEVPDEPVPFAEAVTKPFAPFAIGDRWGPPRGTVWFRARGHVPDGWRIQTGTSVEIVVDLGFAAALPGFQAEGMVYTPSGRILKGHRTAQPHGDPRRCGFNNGRRCTGRRRSLRGGRSQSLAAPRTAVPADVVRR